MTTPDPERARRTQVWLSAEDAALCDEVRMLVGQAEDRPTPARTEVVREALRRYHQDLLRRAEKRARDHRKDTR